MLEGAGNEALTNSLRLLNSRVMLLHSTSIQEPSRARKSVAELAVVMDTLAASDSVAARRGGSAHPCIEARLAGLGMPSIIIIQSY